jgi:hypothetical protein
MPAKTGEKPVWCRLLDPCFLGCCREWGYKVGEDVIVGSRELNDWLDILGDAATVGIGPVKGPVAGVMS